jgi:hypothetical protein
MMKKLVVFSLVLILFSGSVFCATLTGKKNSIGLDSPVLGWLNPNLVNNETSPTISNLGINLGLGVSYRRYFNPVQTNQFNTYWAAGTVALIIPYLGIGGDYVWDNGFYLGGGLIWIVPEIHGGFLF